MKRGLVLCLGLVLAGCAQESTHEGLPARHWYQQLKHRDAAARMHAAQAMARITPRYTRAIPVLTDLLKDEDPYVRWAAASALKHYGPEAQSAIPTLLEVLEKDDSPIARQQAALALQVMDPVRFVNLQAK